MSTIVNREAAIVSLQVGKPQLVQFGADQLETGFAKQPVQGEFELTDTQLQGDGQADLVHHGGPDKAVCAYPHEHYAYWSERLGREMPAASFGENLTLQGLTEEQVHIGDTFHWGEAVLQLSQPRQPCHKLAKRHQLNELPLYVLQTGYTGYYFRVLRPGRVSSFGKLTLAAPHPDEVSVAFANRIMHHDKRNADAIRRILGTGALSASWTATFTARLQAL